MERLERFCEFMRDTFPARSELASMEFVDAALRDEKLVVVTIRQIVWERGEDGSLTIRDIKEQELFMGEVDMFADPRLDACVQGSVMALDHLFAQDDVSWFETLMPSDLLPSFAALLRLKRPRTAEDFAEALLGSRQRLGKFLRG